MPPRPNRLQARIWCRASAGQYIEGDRDPRDLGLLRGHLYQETNVPASTQQKPPEVREFSPRSIAVGLLVALVIGASYPYVVLKFGFGPNISVVSAFFGFLALGLFSKSYNRWENHVVQTAGTTAGQIAFLCWLLAAFDL